jgi:hypothetical protein
MVDYVGDMMKSYQNGVDRIQGRGWVYTDVQHITKSFRFFFRFYFHPANIPFTVPIWPKMGSVFGPVLAAHFGPVSFWPLAPIWLEMG